MRLPSLSLLALLPLLLSACAEPLPDEQRLRMLVDEAELAAEARSVGDLMDLVAQDYSGEQGEDRDRLTQALRGYFIVNQSPHVLTRIHSVTLHSDGTASIDLAVAVARSPFDEAGELQRARGDLFRVQLELAQEDGEWRVYSADRRRGSPGDFL